MALGSGRFRATAWWPLAALFIVVVAGLLAGGPALGQDRGPVKVRWLVGLGASTDDPTARTQQIKDVVRGFNQAHPGTRLSVAIEDGDVVDRLATMIASGKAPDVVGPTGMRLLDTDPGWLMDLEPLINDAGFDVAQLDPALLEAYRSADDGLVGLPFGVFPTLLYYNKDLFDEAGLEYPPTTVDGSYVMPDGTERPWDFETVARLAAILTVDANGNDATSQDFDSANIVQFGFHDQYGEIRRDMAALVGAAPLFASDGAGGGEVTVPDTWLNGLTWLQEARFEDLVMPIGSDLESLRFSQNPFALGRVGMALAPLWYTCCISDLNGSPFTGWDLAVVPIGLNGERTSPLNADTISITAASSNPDAAFEVLQYLLTDPGARSLYPVAPGTAVDRAAYYEGLRRRYPDVANWQVADTMLGFPDIPNNQAAIPDFATVTERLQAFNTLIQSDDGGALDLQAELDTLEADLQAIVDVASTGG